MYFPNFISFNLILLPDAFLFAVCCIVNNACWHQWIGFGGFWFTWKWKKLPHPHCRPCIGKVSQSVCSKTCREASRTCSASWECFLTEVEWLMEKNNSPISPVPLLPSSPRPFWLSSIIKNNKTPTNLIKTSHKSQKEEQVEDGGEEWNRGARGRQK